MIDPTQQIDINSAPSEASAQEAVTAGRDDLIATAISPSPQMLARMIQWEALRGAVRSFMRRGR